MTDVSLPRSFGDRILVLLTRAVLAPIRAFRLQYLPLLMVYFAYGALGIIAVADSFWVKKELTLSPAALAQLGVWLTLPWAVKMVFGELVDTVPLMGSRRRGYVFLGASLIATGLILLAGAAGKWITFAPPEQLYIIAQIVTVIGVVLQDVVADAMSTEVVPRVSADGTPRPQAEIDQDLGMVQILGRLALSFGALSVAGLAGFLANRLAYETVFLIGLAVPAISASGALLVRLESSESRPTDWRILGGGLAFGALTVIIALLQVPYAQEITFLMSLAVIVTMLNHVTGDIDPNTRLKIFYAALIIFFFRATPGVGEGYRWFTIDVLGFDEAFYGVLGQIGAAIALIAAWLLSDAITRVPVARVLLWLTILGGILSLPSLLLVYRVDLWTEATFGFGARTIAIIDAAAASPLAQLSMVPLLTLIAIYAPPSKRAVWFALMASFLNLALIAGQLATKYLNQIFLIERGNYAELPALVVTAVILSVVIPLAAILAFGGRLKRQN
jgi:MFS family permease